MGATVETRVVTCIIAPINHMASDSMIHKEFKLQQYLF